MTGVCCVLSVATGTQYCTGNGKVIEIDRCLVIGNDQQDTALALVAEADRCKDDILKAINLKELLLEKKEMLVKVVDAMKILQKNMKAFMDGQ